jgi:hypothetical protein
LKETPANHLYYSRFQLRAVQERVRHAYTYNNQGVSSKIFESLSLNEFSRSIPLLATCILPFRSGDSPLQYYNTVFSLAHAIRFSDILNIVWNDDCLEVLTANAKGKVLKQQDNFHALNNVSATAFVDFHRDDLSNNVFDVICNVCPIPSAKFCSWGSSLPYSRSSDWNQQLSDLFLSLPNQGLFDKRYKAIGGSVHIHNNSPDKLMHATRIQKYIPTTRNMSLAYLKDKYKCPSMSVVYNNTWILPYLELIIGRALEMYNVRAYWHFYQKYGGYDIDAVFLESLELINNTIDLYKYLQ